MPRTSPVGRFPCRDMSFSSGKKLWLHEWVCPEDGLVEEEGSVDNQENTQGAAEKTPAGESGLDKKCAETDSVSEDIEGDGMEDVYAIGFQELVDLNAVNVAIDIRSQAREREKMFGYCLFFFCPRNIAHQRQSMTMRLEQGVVSVTSTTCQSDTAVFYLLRSSARRVQSEKTFFIPCRGPPLSRSLPCRRRTDARPKKVVQRQ